MNKRVKKKWLKALRNSEVNGKPVSQATGRLRAPSVEGSTQVGLCCLGVLCEMAVAEGVIPLNESTYKSYDGVISTSYTYGENEDTAALPKAVQKWAGLESTDPVVPYKKGSPEPIDGKFYGKPVAYLAGLNDDFDKSFKQIAKKIDKHL